MFGSSPRNAANAYSKVGMETGVFAADPHKLILMLFDGALMAINNSIHQMGAGQIAEKGRSISHAVAIVESPTGPPLNFSIIVIKILLSISSNPFWSTSRASKAISAIGTVIFPFPFI